MQTIEVSSSSLSQLFDNMAVALNAKLTEEWGEYTLEFENDFGEGVIRGISFDWGISLIDYNVNFTEDVRIVFKISDISPIEFIFVSEGKLSYEEDNGEAPFSLERYQNIILSSQSHSRKTFVFPKETIVKVNFIQVIKSEYEKKTNNNLTYLNEVLLSVFKDTKASKSYNHFGSFNLKIAEQIKKLNAMQDSGIIRTLSIEGRLNLILAMQLLEHHNFENQVVLPESLSQEDIRKIHKLSEYILDNISEPMSVAKLSEQSSLSPKKLQLGFRVLYSKSVNEHIRQLKLEIARDELSNTDLTISEIVYKIGLKSRSYFSKIFFEHYGMLPTDYRKAIGVKKASHSFSSNGKPK